MSMISPLLYSVFHKNFYNPNTEYVSPIHAGKAISTENMLLSGDDTGDNISAQNANFAELTALYWIWKNAGHKPGNIWGLCHYRRYFSLPKQRFLGAPRKMVSEKIDPFIIDQIVNIKVVRHIKTLMETHDVIVQDPIYVHHTKGTTLTIEEHFKKEHRAEDWETMKTVLLELYPDYKQSLDTFCKSTTMSFANMMIAKTETWDKYLTWLFSILFEVQKRIVVSDDPAQARVFGFLGERIMNLYIAHEQLRIAYLPITVFDQK